MQTPLIPVHRKQRQLDLCDFEASLVYTVRFRKDKVIQKGPVLGVWGWDEMGGSLIILVPNFMRNSAKNLTSTLFRENKHLYPDENFETFRYNPAFRARG